MIQDFNYSRATTVEEALDLLKKYKDDYKIICGGQSLLILMRQGLVAPENLIDIKKVKELSYIDFTPKKGLRIGATTTHREIEKSKIVKKHYQMLLLWQLATGHWLIAWQWACAGHFQMLELSLSILWLLVGVYTRLPGSFE